MTSPHAILIAGANGAGKTTFARQVLPSLYPSAQFLNADEIQAADPACALPIAAGRELLRRLSEAESRGTSFVVETTLSSHTYQLRIPRWRDSGYRVELHSIELPSVELALKRVAQRVALGGHDVPEDDVRRRFERGRALFFSTYKALVPEWYHWFSDQEGVRLVERHQAD